MKQSIFPAAGMAAIIILSLSGCMVRSRVVFKDEFSKFDRKAWQETEGRISVKEGVLTVDSEGNEKGYIQRSLPESKWRVVEVRARVDKVYGMFVGDILANPGSIYYNRRGTFCIWENSQRQISDGDYEWHTWKSERTDKGLAIYLDGIYRETNTEYDPSVLTLGNELADPNHGVRVSYDWIKVTK